MGTDERFSGNAETGGAYDVIAEDLVDVVPCDLIEIGDESEKEGHSQKR